MADPFKKPMPWSEADEQDLLAAFLMTDDATVRETIAAQIPAAAFYLTDHKIVASAAFGMHKRGEGITPTTVLSQIERESSDKLIGGRKLLVDLSANTLPWVDDAWRTNLTNVQRLWRLRVLIEEAWRLEAAANEPDAEPATIVNALVRRASIFAARIVGSQTTGSPTDDYARFIDAAGSGEFACLPFPWPWLSELSQALRPGTCTVLGGSGGDAKSFMLLQALTFWVEKGIAVSVFMLEENRDFWINRVHAQLARMSKITSPDWHRVPENLRKSRESFEANRDLLEAIGQRIYVSPRNCPTMEEVAAWVRSRAVAGDRIICVDPITRARVSDKRHQDDEAFLAEIAAIADEYKCSLFVITHPPKQLPKGKPGPEHYAGGAAYFRFGQCMMFLTRLATPKGARCMDYNAGAAFTASINRELHLSKTRSGEGQGRTIAFNFDRESLTFDEIGTLESYTTNLNDALDGQPSPGESRDDGDASSGFFH